jgi:hypothetical protein
MLDACAAGDQAHALSDVGGLLERVEQGGTAALKATRGDARLGQLDGQEPAALSVAAR